MKFQCRILAESQLLSLTSSQVNNAGNGAGQGILAADLTTEDVERAFAANFFAALYTTQATLPYMPNQSRIVNIGTVVSRLNSLPGVAAYGAAKAAQDYLTGSFAHELGRGRGITVNTVAPGGTVTDAVGWFPDGELRTQVGTTLLGLTKLGARAGTPEEVADAVLLVVSEQARWITGQYIAASGGI
jgi:NAD(P)-dependent dehydrogenase (short-subunit alcohol dehydrogenase family)